MRIATLAALAIGLTAPACAHASMSEPARLTLTFETGAQTGSVMVSLYDTRTRTPAAPQFVRRAWMWRPAREAPSSLIFQEGPTQ